LHVCGVAPLQRLVLGAQARHAVAVHSAALLHASTLSQPVRSTRQTWRRFPEHRASPAVVHVGGLHFPLVPLALQSAALEHVSLSSHPLSVALHCCNFAPTHWNCPALHAGLPHPLGPLALQIVSDAQTPSDDEEVPSAEQWKSSAPLQNVVFAAQARHFPLPLASHVVPAAHAGPVAVEVAPNVSHFMSCWPEQLRAPGTQAVQRFDPTEHVSALGQVATSA
jgi:hypothetical protein